MLVQDASAASLPKAKQRRLKRIAEGCATVNRLKSLHNLSYQTSGRLGWGAGRHGKCAWV